MWMRTFSRGWAGTGEASGLGIVVGSCSRLGVITPASSDLEFSDDPGFSKRGCGSTRGSSAGARIGSVLAQATAHAQLSPMTMKEMKDLLAFKFNIRMTPRRGAHLTTL